MTFFEHLGSCHVAVTSSHLQAVVLWFGDFNVPAQGMAVALPHTWWRMEAFSILNDLEL